MSFRAPPGVTPRPGANITSVQRVKTSGCFQFVRGIQCQDGDTDNSEEKCQSLSLVGRVNLQDEEEEDTINTSKLEYGIHERRVEFTLLISALFRMSPRFQNLMFRCQNREKTAKPQVSRSSLQCLSWLHYK